VTVPLVPMLSRELMARAASSRHNRSHSLPRTVANADGVTQIAHPGVAAHQRAAAGAAGRTGSPRLHSSAAPGTHSPNPDSPHSPSYHPYSPSPLASPYSSPPHSPLPFPIPIHAMGAVQQVTVLVPVQAQPSPPQPMRVLLPQVAAGVVPAPQPRFAITTHASQLGPKAGVVPAATGAAAAAAAVPAARAGSTSAYAQRRPPLTVKSPLPAPSSAAPGAPPIDTDPSSQSGTPQQLPSPQNALPPSAAARAPFVPSLPLHQLQQNQAQSPAHGAGEACFNGFGGGAHMKGSGAASLGPKPPSPRAIQPPLGATRTSPRDHYSSTAPAPYPADTRAPSYLPPPHQHPSQQQQLHSAPYPPAPYAAPSSIPSSSSSNPQSYQPHAQYGKPSYYPQQSSPYDSGSPLDYQREPLSPK
jgi:hypothetical protein